MYDAKFLLIFSTKEKNRGVWQLVLKTVPFIWRFVKNICEMSLKAENLLHVVITK